VTEKSQYLTFLTLFTAALLQKVKQSS